MPSSAAAHHAPTPTAAEDDYESSSFGQVIEYIRDRLFLASYTHPPTATTPFPYPVKSSRSPSKRSSRAQLSASTNNSAPAQPVYFSIDRYLLYNAFHADFGPLHIGHLYRFAVQIHEVLGDPENEGKPVVFWSHADSRSRANAACILACYMVLIQSWPPHLALAPLAQMDPPLMPFRDAGYSQADYILNVQDVVYGVWKAQQEGLCSLKDFSLEEYEKYERVDMGDFNWISPNFVAFASPQHEPTAIIPTSSAEYAQLPRTTNQIFDTNLPSAFKNVLAHFKARKVGLVVRLNSELYSPSYFTALGISHLDMIFDDGTCPPLTLVKKFIRLAHEVITVKRRQIAVHCKAGLGRTGCLIGAYLIYRYGFTANEVIAYMRFMRPGMVVGPQQHWLHLNQGTFREWWIEDALKEKLAQIKQTSTPPRSKSRVENHQTFTPPNGSHKRRALGELDYNDQAPVAVHDDNLPAPTPGQPRKTSKLYGERHNNYLERQEEEPMCQPDSEIISIERHSASKGGESEEEFQLRMMSSSRRSISPTGKRAVSCMTTTTTTTEWMYQEEDQENNGGRPAAAAKTPSRSISGAGALSVNKRNSAAKRSTTASSGVRKTSGRVGSVGAVNHAAKIKQ